MRIPKSALPGLSARSEAEPFLPPGVVLPYARELMGVTPSERQALEAMLHRHFADVEGRLAAGVYETNKPLSGRFPDAVVASKVFVLPELGNEAKQRADQMLAELRGILGEERWPLVQIRLDDDLLGVTYNSGNVLGRILYLEPSKSGQELLVWVATDDKGTPRIGYTWAGPGTVESNGGRALSVFLPEGDPNRTEGTQQFGDTRWQAALRQHGLTWLQEQAAARVGKGARP